MLAVALGDKETSLSLLAKAVEDREPELIWAKADPRLDVIWGKPRFIALIDRVFSGL